LSDQHCRLRLVVDLLQLLIQLHQRFIQLFLWITGGKKGVSECGACKNDQRMSVEDKKVKWSIMAMRVRCVCYVPR
jgi:hypothetical protein